MRYIDGLVTLRYTWNSLITGGGRSLSGKPMHYKLTAKIVRIELDDDVVCLAASSDETGAGSYVIVQRELRGIGSDREPESKLYVEIDGQAHSGYFLTTFSEISKDRISFNIKNPAQDAGNTTIVINCEHCRFDLEKVYQAFSEYIEPRS